MKIRDLTGGYGDEMIVKNISFEIQKGEFLGIIGPNGSGKSTLLRLMSRVLSPRKGEIQLEGKDVQHMDLKRLSQKVAFVPQETMFNFSFSVEEIVLMGRIPHLKRTQQESKKDYIIAEHAMALTDTLSLKNRNMDELSAGERQRVIIARALAQEPNLLFLDEPTSHLDIGHQIQMLDLLKKLNKEASLTILIVLHDLNLASEYCSRILLFEKGRIYSDGTPQEVLTYQNIEAVYKTLVIVQNNPVSLKPYCILVSEQENKL